MIFVAALHVRWVAVIVLLTAGTIYVYRMTRKTTAVVRKLIKMLVPNREVLRTLPVAGWGPCLNGTTAEVLPLTWPTWVSGARQSGVSVPPPSRTLRLPSTPL